MKVEEILIRMKKMKWTLTGHIMSKINNIWTKKKTVATVECKRSEGRQ